MDGLTVVGEAQDGQTIIEQIDALELDIILLVLNTQSDACIVTRISERYPHVKILVLGAGNDQTRLALDVFKQGAQGYLDRDTNPLSEIVGAIRTLSRGGAVLDPGMAGWILDEIVYMQRKNTTEGKERDV